MRLLTQVSYKKKAEKGKITLKLRKLDAGKWVDRWSPRREPIANDNDIAAAAVTDGDIAATAAGGTSEPIVTFPSDDDDE